jgi:hypothetical protein
MVRGIDGPLTRLELAVDYDAGHDAAAEIPGA